MDWVGWGWWEVGGRESTSPMKAGSLCPSPVLFCCLAQSTHRGCSIITWLWLPGGLAFLGPLGLKQRDNYWQATTTQRTDWNTHPVSCEKDLLTCPGTSAWGTGICFTTCLETMEVLPGNIGQKTPSLWSPSALLQLAHTLQKRAYTLIWSSDFCNYCPGDICTSPGLKVSSVYNCSPTGLYIFAYLKSYCLMLGFQSAWS